MAEHPESYSGWYGFESRWVHVIVQTCVWLAYAAVFFAMDRWKRNIFQRIQGFLALGTATAFAFSLQWLAWCFWVVWACVLAYMFWDTWRMTRHIKIREAELLASFQVHVNRWTCPHCGQRDFRVLPPVTNPVVECAECRYKVPDLPKV